MAPDAAVYIRDRRIDVMIPIGLYIACFFGAVFFVNGIPHFVNGVSGKPFPTPFASPPGRGKSSAVLNVIWGAINFLIAYLLLCYFFYFDPHILGEVLAFTLGALVIGLMTARHFEKVGASDK